MSAVHDQEYLDTLEAEFLKRRRKTKPPTDVPAPSRVDRQSPRWKRLRASLCEHSGLGGPDELDEYCDRVYRLVPR